MTAHNQKYPVLLLFAALIVVTSRCQVEHGLEPIRSGIQGTIHYLGHWPAKTAEVRIVAATKFPPADLNDLIIGDILPIGGDSVIYTFYLKPGSYYLGLVWRESEAAWGIQSIFGIYTEPGNPFSPGLITVPDDRTIITGKDISADFANAKRASSSRIAGKIYFKGQWPANAENVMVIASRRFPPTSLLDFSFSGLLPAYIDSSDYYIPAAPDTYRALGAVLKLADQPWALENIIGLLLKPNSFEPQSVIVPNEDSQVAGINLTVYFR
ncbi:MAG: hypothetical protein ONB16_09470 [candidate division KSB1 bacterium]|nr:hypothetical protein [candidate division KSB1 bacterium]MDZ7319591.1 hypothetical protein [candidate division KSB1 bacterium]MDZ7340401.1 hypothetical protein [candidate division KSB1 bacterium]